MKNILAALPNREIINTVFQLRETLVDNGWCQEDERNTVLPHVSLSYLTDVSNRKLGDDISLDLDKITANVGPFFLVPTGINVWDQKLVLMFDNSPLRDLVSDLDILFRRHNLSWNDEYLEELNTKIVQLGRPPYRSLVEAIGDHMKLFRGVSSEYLDEISSIARNLSKDILFNRLVIMSYGCTEEDILWQKEL